MLRTIFPVQLAHCFLCKITCKLNQESAAVRSSSVYCRSRALHQDGGEAGLFFPARRNWIRQQMLRTFFSAVGIIGWESASSALFFGCSSSIGSFSM